MRGPLNGIRVVEFSCIGPGPHCAMLLSDMGAEVLRIDRPGGNGWPNPVVDRGRYVLELDIHIESSHALVMTAIDKADILIEGFRPGVMERLGFDYQTLATRNPRLIYARVTGWGQTGPFAKTAGHDINYLALTGALEAIQGVDGRPIPPLNLIGDFGGGSLYLTVGILAALHERERSGRGQVVEAAIVDGVAHMMSMFAGLLPAKRISLHPDENLLGGRAPFYRCYKCADEKYVAVGALEPKFYEELLYKVHASDTLKLNQYESELWSDHSEHLAAIFKQRTRDEWCALFEGSNGCLAPVLTFAESLVDAHLVARSTYVNALGMLQVAPSPRFSRTPGEIRSGGDASDLINRWTSQTG